MPSLIILGLLLPVDAPLAQPYKARVRLPAYPAVIALDTIAVRTEVPAPKLEVFQVAAAALETEFKIELKIRDSTSGLVGNLELVKLRSLGRSPMSRYVSCGSGMTGPNADSYRVYLAIIAIVDSVAPDKTRLGVALAAAAQDLQGSSKQPVMCGSTGALEGQVRRLVAARFGMRGP
jgi:hypothetical protein